MTSDAGSDARCTIGARLRSARERSGLSLLQAAEKLHVDASVLESLERGEFENLGAPVFVRGHIRRYAELVRESATELQALYTASSGAESLPDLTKIPKAQPEDESQRFLIPGVIVVTVVAIVGIVWWVINSIEDVTPPAAPEAVRVNGAPQPPAVSEASVEATPSSTGQGTVTQTAPVTQPVADVASAAPAAEEPQATPAPPAASSRTSELKLRFSADSWAEVYDAAGQRLFYDVGSADSERMLTGTPPFRIVLGNPSGVTVEVNGRGATVPTATGPDGTVQFTVTRTGRVNPSP